MNDYEPETDKAWRLLNEHAAALLRAVLDTKLGRLMHWLVDSLAARLG